MLEYQALIESAFTFITSVPGEVFIEYIVSPDFCYIKEESLIWVPLLAEWRLESCASLLAYEMVRGELLSRILCGSQPDLAGKWRRTILSFSVNP